MCMKKIKIIFVSLITFFSFSLLVNAASGTLSVSSDNPGVAFGITTIALFLGILPTMFFDVPKGIAGSIMLTLVSFSCSIIFGKVLKR